jgi:branched-chain amino acid aminotransferase
MKIFFDGKFLSQNDARVSVFDHGFLYGDGVFEGIRTYDGRIFKLDEHLSRLEESASAILLKIPMSRKELRAAVLETCRQNKLRNGYIRLIVTRGVGSLGLNPFNCNRGSVVIIGAKIHLYPAGVYRRGLHLITAATERNSPRALNPAIKSLNYLNNILAKIEAIHAGKDEAVMLNAEGYIAECTGDNLFVIRQGAFYTPPIAAGALRGITRSVVMELIKEHFGRAVHEMNLTRHDVFSADECFLTGTAAEVVPAISLDGREIGSGKPGEATRKLMKKFALLTRREGTPFERVR